MLMSAHPPHARPLAELENTSEFVEEKTLVAEVASSASNGLNMVDTYHQAKELVKQSKQALVPGEYVREIKHLGLYRQIKLL